MLKLVKLIFFSLMMYVANAQTHHFIYIENQNKQPFIVQFNGKTVESKTKNFVTLSQLESGMYNITIGSESNKISKFSINLEDIDLGFILKKNANNDLVLFDINRFTTLEQGEKIVDTKPIEKVVVKQTKIDSVVENKTSTKSIIKKIGTKKNNDGLEEIYIDSNNKKVDTISVFIPYNSIIVKDTAKEAKPQPVQEQTMKSSNLDVTTTIPNSCLVVASERDVAHFSGQVQSALTLKNKLKMASVLLKEKCYSVNQIKRLGVLFLNESGKFNFYKLSQTSISDIKNYRLLSQEFKDEVLKKEFLALINPQ